MKYMLMAYVNEADVDQDDEGPAATRDGRLHGVLGGADIRLAYFAGSNRLQPVVGGDHGSGREWQTQVLDGPYVGLRRSNLVATS